MKVALLVNNGGDGSYSINYFRDIEMAYTLANEEECFFDSDSVDIIEVPEDFNPPGGFSDDEYEENEEDE